MDGSANSKFEPSNHIIKVHLLDIVLKFGMYIAPPPEIEGPDPGRGWDIWSATKAGGNVKAVGKLYLLLLNE